MIEGIPSEKNVYMKATVGKNGKIHNFSKYSTSSAHNILLNFSYLNNIRSKLEILKKKVLRND